MRFSRIGLKLAETFNKGYRWQHEAVIALARAEEANSVELTESEAEEWYRGRDIWPQAALPRDEVLVTATTADWPGEKVGQRLKTAIRASWCATANCSTPDA